MENSLEIHLNPFKQLKCEPNFYEDGISFYKKIFYYMVSTKNTRYLRIELLVKEALDDSNKKIFNEIFRTFNYIKEEHPKVLDLINPQEITRHVILHQDLYSLCNDSCIALVGELNMDNFSHELIDKIINLPFYNLDVSNISNVYSLEDHCGLGLHDYKVYLTGGGFSNGDILEIKNLFFNHFTGKTSPNMTIYYGNDLDNDYGSCDSKEEIGW